MKAIYDIDTRFSPATLQYFAPDFRCAAGHVEIPDGWQLSYHWDHDAGTEEAVLAVIRDHGQRARTFGGSGYRVPRGAWDAAMSRVVGVTWDKSRISDDEAMSILRQADETQSNNL